MHRLRVIAAVGMLALASCSGSSTDSSSTTEPRDLAPSTTEPLTTIELSAWVDAADEICAEGDEAREALGEPETEEEFLEMLDQQVESFTSQIEDMRALGRPDESADLVDEALELLDERLELILEILEEADGDVDTIVALFESSEDERDANESRLDEIAEELGTEECGSDDEDDDASEEEGDLTEQVEPELPDELAAEYGDYATWRAGVIDGAVEGGLSPGEAACVVDALVVEYSIEEIHALATEEMTEDMSDFVAGLGPECESA